MASARALTISFQDLQSAYPDADVSSFVPTHRVELLDRENRVLRQDYVCVEEDHGEVSFASIPGSEDPLYSVLPNGLWQCLDQNGRVRAVRVKYVPDYVRLSDQDGFVYFALAGGCVKIGWSRDVARRMEELQVGNAHKIELLGTIEGRLTDESLLHKKFGHLHRLGEWYEDGPEIRDFLERL